MFNSSLFSTGAKRLKYFLAIPTMLLAVTALLSGGAVGASAFGLDTQSQNNVADTGTPKRLRLLTTQQYINTIQYFFGPDIKIDAKFAPLTRTDGVLMAGTSIAGVSGAQIETYQKVASLVSAQVLDATRRKTLVPCTPKSEKEADKACASKFLHRVMNYLYYVPVSNEYFDTLVKQAGVAANTLNDFYGGLQLVLEGVLLSPNVLFVAENEEPDPKHSGHLRLDAYSQAARLSLFLWNAAPDPALRAAADRGELFDAKKRARVIDAMLASPRLETGVRAFFDDMFGFDDMETLSKDSTTYPYFVGGAAADAREQTLRTVVDRLLTKGRDYRDIYTSRETFVSPPLAIIYGVPTTPGWREIEFPPEAHRAGILTEVSFLALHSHATRSSATLRGKALRELILCQKVPPPPANVDFSKLNNPDPSLRTARDRLDAHRQNPVCAGCHKITDPMGLALENFDGVGQYRASEMNTPIDPSGSLDGKNFTDIEGLGQAVHDSPALPTCLVRRAFSYATAGALPTSVDPVLNQLTKDFVTQGYRLRPLLKKITMDSAFSDVVIQKPAPTPAKAASLISNQLASNP